MELLESLSCQMRRVCFLIFLFCVSGSFAENISSNRLQTATSNIAHKSDELLQECSILQECTTTRARKQRAKNHKEPKKKWVLIVYMAADNDLRSFAARNIKQMASIGSNEHLTILAHLDIRVTGNKKITRRYYVEKDKIIHVNVDDPSTQKMDSGDPQTLISCCKWAIENHPADHYALVFWNHGTGILDPSSGRVFNSSELFMFNPLSNKLELDRSVPFMDFVTLVNARKNEELKQRGICWDDSTGNFLNNQKLESALNTICQESLGGKKFDLIGFDACLMSMIEVASLVKNYAHVMVGSQEVELGSGWNYQMVLSPFVDTAPTPKEFAQHITTIYSDTYNKITNDYTQSAVDLDNINELETNVDVVAKLLLECFKYQKGKSVKNAVKTSRNKLLCTHFDEPTYIDLHHFYTNLLLNLKYFSFDDDAKAQTSLNSLKAALADGCTLIKKLVLANVAGKNLSNAMGISIYFPLAKIHPSYRKAPFAQSNAWIDFLNQYLLL